MPAPTDWTPESETDQRADEMGLTAPSVELVAPEEPAPGDQAPGDEVPAERGQAGGSSIEGAPDGRGLIAAAGPTGLRLLVPSGQVVGELGPDQIVTQPTWSRDGRRLAATLIDPASGVSQVAVVDIATGNVVTASTPLPYFFYTWSYDGSRLVALGPSQEGGTAAFILDETGAPASDVWLQGQSIFVAWEPGGRRLLLHTGHRLLLVNDVDSPRDHNDYGLVGIDFLAPAWVPGTQDFLYVDSYGQAPADAGEQELLDRRATTSPQLLRRSADTGEITDLGPAGLYTMMAVHPSGDRAAISTASPEPPASAGEGLETASISEPAPTAQAVSENGVAAGSETEVPAVSETGVPALSESGVPAGSVQIVDLATAERRTVLDTIGLWLEWSPDGDHLLIAAAANDPEGTGLSWHIWDGQQSYELARFAPTETFLRDYLRFADQYDETPRLWSPDSDAITFGANTADGDVTAVARLSAAGAVTSLGPSDVSFWSPIP